MKVFKITLRIQVLTRFGFGISVGPANRPWFGFFIPKRASSLAYAFVGPLWVETYRNQPHVPFSILTEGRLIRNESWPVRYIDVEWGE